MSIKNWKALYQAKKFYGLTLTLEDLHWIREESFRSGIILQKTKLAEIVSVKAFKKDLIMVRFKKQIRFLDPIRYYGDIQWKEKRLNGLAQDLTAHFAKAAASAVADLHNRGLPAHGEVDGVWTEVPPPVRKKS